MSDEEAKSASADERTTPPAGRGAPANGPGLSLPGLIGRLGLYATYVTAAILVLVLAADAAVLLRNPAPSLLLSLLLSIGPLVALLLSSFASYVNYYGTWRILRRQDEYQAGQDLKSHAADIPEALQGVLMRRSGCLPLASCLALVLSLVLATLTIVPSSIPVAGAVGAYTQQLGGLAAASRATSTPLLGNLTTSTPAAAPTPLPTATATAIPTTTASPRPTVAPTATATPTPTPSGPVINFTISPTTATWPGGTGGCPGVPPQAQTLTLDNSKSTVAVSWQASAVEMLPSGAPWATITPVASGMVAAGATQSITVTPATILCRYSSANGTAWHISVVTTNAGTYTFTYMVF